VARDIIPVFVVGCPRSGTTLVGELIAASPRVLNGEESFFIYLMYRWRAMLRPPVAPLTTMFLDRARSLMHELITAETVAAGKQYFLDHTPWHALCLEDVWMLFPNARVIHVVRHPADVVASLRHSYEAGYRWAGQTVAERVVLWKTFVAAMQPNEQDPRVRLIRYEDLCASPAEQTRSLLDWLNLSYSEDYLAVFARPHAPGAGSSFTLATQTPAGLEFHPRRRRQPSPALLSQLRDLAAEDARRYGYVMGARDS
jgi:hypothetical protein